MDKGYFPDQLNSKASLSNKVFDIATMDERFGLKVSLIVNVDIKAVLLEASYAPSLARKLLSRFGSRTCDLRP